MATSGNQKVFVLITSSESGDNYSYQIEHASQPTSEEIERFLLENGSDVEDGECYEYQEMLIEIDADKFKSIK